VTWVIIYTSSLLLHATLILEVATPHQYRLFCVLQRHSCATCIPPPIIHGATQTGTHLRIIQGIEQKGCVARAGALVRFLFLVQLWAVFGRFCCGEEGINPLTPNDPYSGRTAPLTSKRCILYIYSTNTDNEYFKHGIYSPFFIFKMQFVS